MTEQLVIELEEERFIAKLIRASDWWIKFTTESGRYELHVDGDSRVYLSPSILEMNRTETRWFVMEVHRIFRGESLSDE